MGLLNLYFSLSEWADRGGETATGQRSVILVQLQII